MIFFGVGEEVAQAANRLKNPKTLAKRFTLPPFSTIFSSCIGPAVGTCFDEVTEADEKNNS